MPPEPGHLWLSEESPHVQRGLGASAGCALNPVRAFTHTLTSSPSGVVDRQRAIPILAAGLVRHIPVHLASSAHFRERRTPPPPRNPKSRFLPVVAGPGSDEYRPSDPPQEIFGLSGNAIQ